MKSARMLPKSAHNKSLDSRPGLRCASSRRVSSSVIFSNRASEWGNFMIRKMQFLFLVIFIVALTSPAKSLAYPFLTKSKILKNIGAQILVGEDQGDAIVFDKDVLMEHKVPADGSGSYLITSNGLKPLEGKVAPKNLLKMCGDPYPGIGFNKENNNGIFIATGKNLEGVIQWHPAEHIETKKSNCLKGLPADGVQFASYLSTVLNGVIHQARWKRVLTNKEIEVNCRSYAEFNAKINQQTPAENLFKNCMKDSWMCHDEERLIVSFQSNKGECKKVIKSQIDCDGKALAGENLHEFLGVIVIKKDSEQETWLIWNAPGYEGDGVYAIEIKDLGKKVKPSEEWLVYNGC